MKKIFISVATILTFLSACSKDDAPVVVVPPPVVVPPDTTLQAMLPFPIGAAINTDLLQSNTKYSSVVLKEFNSLTPENIMKFSSIHSAQNTYNWNNPDYLVNYAILHKKRVHGHTLVWHRAVPDWVTNFTGDSAAWENLLKTHIQTVVSHFKGKVGSWDVVNEVLEDDGSMRNTIWLQKLGNDYVARCFQYAHEADTSALLFYNDYGHEYSATKRAAIINMVTALKNRGIPIQGIGMQFHTRYNQTDANIAAAITAAASTGLKVHISELDIALNPDNIPGLAYSALLAQLQAAKYQFIVNKYNAIPASQKFGITTWNVGDADSWIPSTYSRPDWPLLFDGNYLRKPAYYAMINGAK